MNDAWFYRLLVNRTYFYNREVKLKKKKNQKSLSLSVCIHSRETSISSRKSPLRKNIEANELLMKLHVPGLNCENMLKCHTKEHAHKGSHVHVHLQCMNTPHTFPHNLQIILRRATTVISHLN